MDAKVSAYRARISLLPGFAAAVEEGGNLAEEMMVVEEDAYWVTLEENNMSEADYTALAVAAAAELN